MKISNIQWFLAFLLFISITGCLKDSNFDDGKFQSINGSDIKVISLGLNVKSATDKFAIVAFDNAFKDTVVDIVPVELGGPGVATEDIHVTLEQVDSLVDNYNEDNDTHYAIPEGITIMNEVTIPKGSRTGYLQIKLIPNSIIGVDYALGFKIKSVAEAGYTISGNLNSGVAAIVTKNEYDGTYEATGYFQHPTVPRSIDDDVKLKTVSQYSISKMLGDLGEATSIILTIDPVTNKVKISAGPGANVGSTATVGNIEDDPQYNNTYDPATKTFSLKYGYPLPGPSRIVTEKLVKE